MLYMFSTLAVSLFTLGFAVVVYRKTRDPLVGSYLAVHLTFGLCILGQFFAGFHDSSRLPTPPVLVDVNAYVQGFILPFFVIVTLPRFIHQLFAMPHARRRNMIFFGIAMFTYSIGQFFEFAVKDESLRHLHPGITSVVVSLVLLYGVVWGLRYLPAIQDEPRRALARKTLILLGITIPVMWLDLFHIVPQPLHPMIYMALCMIVPHHFLKYNLSPSVHPVVPPIAAAVDLPEPLPAVADPDAAEIAAERSLTALLTEDLYQRYGISPREQELVPLVLQGNSNQRIGEILFISLSTVKTHLRNIYSKFGVKNRYELIAFLQNLSK